MKIVIYLEGLPGSGKSSLVNKLIKQDSSKYVSVPEVIEEKKLVEKHNTFEQDFFLKNDSVKYEMAMKIIGKKHNVVIDRSPLSTYIFNILKSKKLQQPISKIIEDWFQELWPRVSSGSLFVYLKVNPNMSLIRKARLSDNNDPWANIHDLDEADKLYLKYLSLLPQKNVLYVDSDNKSLEIVLYEITKFVEKFQR